MAQQVPDLLSYTLDEICIITTGIPSTVPMTDRYEHVRIGLNARLQNLNLDDARLFSSDLVRDRLSNPLTALAGLIEPFLNDLSQGDGLKSLLSSEILQSIDLLPGLPNDGRWIDMPTTAGTTHYFFKINVAQAPAAIREDPQARHRLVRDLTLLINVNRESLKIIRSQIGDTVYQTALEDVRAAPNWLCTIAGSPCNSPAAPPVDDNSVGLAGGGFWGFEFPANSPAAQTAATGRGSNATSTAVVILDTSPIETIRGTFATTGAAVKDLADTYMGNVLLRRVADEVTFDDPQSPPASTFDQMVDYIWDEYVGAEKVNGNHGLFIAGIVHDIAPVVETHLVRAMHVGGVSDIRRFTAIMAQLPAYYLSLPGIQHVVVNMSVDFTVPPGIELLKKTFPELYEAVLNVTDITTLSDLIALLDPLAIVPLIGEFASLLLFLIEDLTAGVTQALDILTSNDHILVVGAAGNDNNGLHHTASGKRPDPRWPAYDESVLAVAATREDGTPTHYSNLGDIIGSPANGIATFGGDTTVSGAGAVTIDPADPIRGIGEMPGGSAAGRLYWAGTSFSTPVISALAANYWNANPTFDSTRVRNDVIALNDTATNVDLDCDAITAHQAWRAEWWRP